MLPMPDSHTDLADWSSSRLRGWADALDERQAPRGVNWWLRARWTLQLRAYDRTLDAESRQEWAEVFLVLVGCMQRFTGYDRWNADADRFNMRALLIRELGQVDGSTTWNADALARDVLATLTLSVGQARKQSQQWRSLPPGQILTLRRHKILLTPLESIAARLSRSSDTDAVREWLAMRPALP
jgi:hypothetical protein